MTPLDQLVRDRITCEGPMSVAAFMELALGHPQYGYYMTRDPFGAAGDFTTAPEISQMFGEMIGVWVADTWIRLGRPSPFMLIEAGPGRGTLMDDLLRSMRSIPGLLQATKIFMVETSPVLKKIQQERLSGYAAEWCESLDDPKIQSWGDPVVFIANEFLDALPIRQFVGEQERKIDVLERRLIFIPESVDREIQEISPGRDCFAEKLCRLLKKNSGAALMIDYGYEGPAKGNTLQALKNHRFVPVLEDIGNCDLTAHVDFSALAAVAKNSGIQASKIVSQGDFLLSLGMQLRLEGLLQSADVRQAQDLRSGFDRLVSPAAMGNLFKVIALCHDTSINLSGF